MLNQFDFIDSRDLQLDDNAIGFEGEAEEVKTFEISRKLLPKDAEESDSE